MRPKVGRLSDWSVKFDRGVRPEGHEWSVLVTQLIGEKLLWEILKGLLKMNKRKEQKKICLFEAPQYFLEICSINDF